VSQISPPIRVLLLCAVAFLAGYMLFLRPKEEPAPPPAEPAPNLQTDAPAVSAPGKIVEKAQGAVEAANERTRKLEGTDGESGAAGATAARRGANGAAPGAVPADLKGVPKPVQRAIRQQKVLALLFWNPRSADDRAVRAELRRVDRWDGRVFVHAAPIRQISRWGRIARGVNVEQSPTVVVVDPQLRAEALVGYVDALTIEQAVVDALRSSGGLFDDRYLAKINEVCSKHYGSIIAVADADFSGGQSPEAYMRQMKRRYAAYHADFKAVPAPKRWRAFKAASVSDNAAHAALIAEWSAYLGPTPSRVRVASSLATFAPREHTITRRFAKRMDDHNVVSCGVSR
jgi:hypothetical protein